MAQHDDALSAARSEVEHLFGQCVLRLQACELYAKFIVANHRFSVSNTGEKVANDTARKTMGTVVGEMIGSFLVAEGQQGFGEDPEDAPAGAFRIQIARSGEDFERIEADLRELVALRNTLVHNFLEQHDLRTMEGCLDAQQALRSDLERATRSIEELRTWVDAMQQVGKAAAEQLASPEMRDLLAHGRIPWHIATITQALQEAATELAKGDWTPVDTAACWIKERYPDEQPEGYGCRSWRQVIHEAGCFDLQVRKVDGRRQAWYRQRKIETAKP